MRIILPFMRRASLEVNEALVGAMAFFDFHFFCLFD